MLRFEWRSSMSQTLGPEEEAEQASVDAAEEGMIQHEEERDSHRRQGMQEKETREHHLDD